MDFDPSEFSAYKAQTASFDEKEFASFKSGKKAETDESPEPADHGLSERQKLSPVGKALNPITGYWDTYQRMKNEALQTASEGVHQLSNPESLTDPKAHGISDVLTGGAKAVLGGVGYAASPISAAYRSVAGQPIEDVTGIPREYTEFAGQLATPGIGLVGAAKAPPVRMPGSPVVRPAEGLAGASERLAETGNAVEIPRAMASDNMAVQRAGQAIRNIPIVGDAIPKATGRLGEQLEGAASNIASDFGGGGGQNVAHKIGQTISSAAEQEAATAKAAAAQSDAAVLGDWERSVRNTNEAITGVEQGALQRARQSLGDMSPQDMGETLIARLRRGEREAHATKERLYGVAGASDAAIDANAVRNIRRDVAKSLDEQGVFIDPGPNLTPAAARMMQELDNVPVQNVVSPRAAGSKPPIARSEREQHEYAQYKSAREDDIAAADFPGDRAGSGRPISVQGLEQTRKRLSAIKQSASNDADRRAAGQVMRAYDDWIDNAFDNALFSGSDEALDAYKRARAANAEWRQRFGFNAKDDADRVVNRIVTGEVTPQEVANYVVGATKVGSKGVSSRLITRITEATGGDPDAMNAIRAGVWNRLSQSTEGVTGKAAIRVADDIGEFLSGSGRDVANRLFSEPQRAVARAYADTLRRGALARESTADIAANTRPGQMEVGIGPFQQLAKAVLGGGRSDEALYSAINSYAKSGSKGDINLLSKVLQAIPQSERGNLAGAMVRDMGVSPRTGQFSPDVFVSTWNTYRPEAKALLFGMSGPQRVALDDIAAISLRMKEVGSKFGNPSGTAQNINFLGLASAFFAAPLTTLTTGVGGAVVAKVLSSPIGASSVSKWSRAYERATTLPGPASSETLTRATNLLAINIHRDSGMPIKDIVRQLQGPVPAGAQDEKP